MTLERQLGHVIFERVSDINGFDMEEALMSMITERVKTSCNVNKVLAKAGIEAYTVPVEDASNEKVEKGVYVYCSQSILDWTYERFDTIADAIRTAVRMFDAYIISNGNIIKYDALDDNTAYYYENNIMKLVHI